MLRMTGIKAAKADDRTCCLSLKTDLLPGDGLLGRGVVLDVFPERGRVRVALVAPRHLAHVRFLQRSNGVDTLAD